MYRFQDKASQKLLEKLKTLGQYFCYECLTPFPIKDARWQTKYCPECYNKRDTLKPKQEEVHFELPNIKCFYSYVTYRFVLSVRDGDDMVDVYKGYIDDLWCHLGTLMKQMGLDINEDCDRRT